MHPIATRRVPAPRLNPAASRPTSENSRAQTSTGEAIAGYAEKSIFPAVNNGAPTICGVAQAPAATAGGRRRIGGASPALTEG